jgi:hypothetical protein
MNIDLDTFLITVYCIVDDVYHAFCEPAEPVKPGPRPELSNSEVVTLVLLAQWDPRRSERRFLRYAHTHWRGYFPRLLSQSAFNRRARALVGVIAWIGPMIGEQVTAALGEGTAYEVLDSVPVPVMRRCRGRQHRLFTDEAGVGRGGSDKEWFYGVRLLPAVTPAGVIGGFVVGSAATAERWLADSLLRWRQDPTAPMPTAAELAPVLGPTHQKGGERVGPTGPIWPALGAGKPADSAYIGDLGFEGKAWSAHWRQDYGATVLTKALYEETAKPEDRQRLAHWFGSIRQIVETVQGVLVETFSLRFPRARTGYGLITRLSAKVAACNLALYLNHLWGRPLLSMLNLSPFE